MSAKPLLRHGEHIKPHYAPAPGEAENWAGQSTDEARPDGNSSGIVKRYNKRQRASELTHSLGLIDQIYTHAIRYNANLAGLRGLSLMAGLFTLGIVPIAILGSWQEIERGDWFVTPIFIVLVILSCTTAFIWSVRLELFRPIDEPTIFDRKQRKVYRVFCEAQPGWTGLFKPWPLRAVEYEWDLIDAEHTATLVTTASTLRREHALVFIVRRSADDPTIIDSFNIGNSLIMVMDDAVDAVWEHIRRFMEDNGPHLPDDETLTEYAPQKSFWARLRDVTPFGKPYWEWWREQFPMMLLAHVLLPLSVLFIGLWVFLGWLTVKTSKQIEWPPEVLAAVGPVVTAPSAK